MPLLGSCSRQQAGPCDERCSGILQDVERMSIVAALQLGLRTLQNGYFYISFSHGVAH